MLCEKPVAYDYRDTLRAAALREAEGLKTKLGFTFRYSPAMQYMKELIDEGFVGTPFIFNGYEQNSQWLDSADAAAAGRPRSRSVGHPGVVARGLRRADHGPRAPVHGQPLQRRWSAR